MVFVIHTIVSGEFGAIIVDYVGHVFHRDKIAGSSMKVEDCMSL